MNLRLISLLGFCAAILAGSASAKPAAVLDPASLAGVYKQQFENGLVSGETFTSEDILEIVQTGPATAYVRVHLEFFNAHFCDIWGIAHVEKGELVYRSKDDPFLPGDPPCVLRVFRQSGKVQLDDGGSCRAFCGARGSLQTDFPYTARRPIRYLSLLKGSREFAEAVAEDAKAPRR